MDIATDPTRTKEGQSKPKTPKLQTRSSVTRANTNDTEATQNADGDEREEKMKTGFNKTGSPRDRRTPVTRRTWSGTANSRITGKRNRSEPVIQGSERPTRTKNRTTAQMNRVELPEPEPTEDLRQPSSISESRQRTSEFLRDETCSCCSSDDELMLRSHSHYDLDARRPEWKIVDPPSPVVRGLRRAKRRKALGVRGKIKGKNRQGGSTHNQERRTRSNVDDDELDLLGTFVLGK